MEITTLADFFHVEKPLEKICKPLFLHTPFSYFDYERYYYNGYYVQPSLIPEFGYEAFKKKLLPSLEELHLNNSHYIYLSPSLILPEAAVDQNKFVDNIKIGNDFDVYHRLCLFFRAPQYAEAFAFGLTKHNKNVTEIFMNHIGFLEKFCVYFREVAQDLISQTNERKIKFDHTLDQSLFNDLELTDNVSYINIFKDGGIKKYSMQGKDNNRMLSMRELECVFWLAKNKTAKEISRLLSLSPRTVEDYLLNVKNKLGCQTKFELIDLVVKNPIIKSFIE